MLTSFKFTGGKLVRRVAAALVLSTSLLTGCASAGITSATEHAVTVSVKPQTIYVYSFGIDVNDVKVDKGGALHKIAASFGGESDAQKQTDKAVEASNDVADEIVATLQKQGLRAVRADAPPPADQNALIIEGHFNTVDEGNRRRRMVIGLGAGKSEVGASVQVIYQPAGGAPQLLQTFDASADSGHAPGFAETAGVGAAAGHVATAAVAGTGLHAVSEKKRAGVSAETDKIAQAIAKQIAKLGESQGWVVPAQS